MLKPVHRPRSFVIVGGSVSGLALAGALSRRPGNRVVVLSGPPDDGRRLVAGCSLRASALHHLAAALGVTVPALVGRLTGGVLDAYHGFESGAPGIANDGMYAMAVAARACTHVPIGLPALVARLAPQMLVRQYVPGWVAPAEPSPVGA